MGATARMGSLDHLLSEGFIEFERATTAAMREATTGLKEEMRDQVFGAGLGRRLAYTWQGETYPKGGASLNPAAYVYSRSPKIMSLFATGAVIRPSGGRQYLWIPTQAVPRSRGRGAKARMSPEEVERHFNTDIFIRNGRGGRKLAYVEASPERSRARRGQATKGPRAKPSQLIHVFTLVREVRGRKLLDLAGPARRWATRFPGLVEKNWIS